MTPPRTVTFSAMVAVAVAMLATGAGASEPPDRMATLTPAGASVIWLVDASSGGTVLTVSGKGVEIRQEHARGEAPALSLSRPDGGALPDGVYTWELTESFAGLNDGVFDPENGRDAVDPTSAPERVVFEGRVESGAFTVKNGLVVDSSLEEASARAESTTKGDDS